MELSQFDFHLPEELIALRPASPRESSKLLVGFDELVDDFFVNIIKYVNDDDLIVIDKPAGISMHPGPGNYDNTIVNALMGYEKIKLSSIGDELRPGIIHRIDKDTSGLKL